MKIRKATESDIDSIVSLRMKMLNEVAAFIPDGLQGKIREYLESNIPAKNCLCALMEIDGEMVGKAMLCCYQTMPDEFNVSGKYAALFSVYTLPDYRGKGYMRDLLVYLLEWAKQQGIEEVVASAEEKAVPLYESIGFRLVNHEMKIQLS